MDSLTQTLESLRNRPVFCAYNANVDAIVDVNDDLEAALDPPHDEAVREVASPSDLATAIAETMAQGEGDERSITDECGEWLDAHVTPKERRVGGQAGIMADFLSVVGAEPIIYTYLLSSTQRAAFHDPDRIRFPVVEGDSLSFPQLSETTNAESTKTNWVFQFEPGTDFFETTATTATRFIGASRPEAFDLEIGDLADHAAALGAEVDCAILSGYHALKPRYADGTTAAEHIDSGRRFLEALASETAVQVEYGVTHDEALRERIVSEIAPLADVVGVDVRELGYLAGDLELSGPDDDIESRCETMRAIRDALGVSAVKLHARDYFVAVTDGYVDADHVREGFEFASVVAAAKAHHGRLTDGAQLEDGLSVTPTSEAVETVRTVTDETDVVAVPNRVFVDHASTVGIGDVVSCASFVLEQVQSQA